MLGRAGALLGPESRGVPAPPAGAGGLLLPLVCSGLVSLGWRRLHEGCPVPSAAPRSFARHHGLSGAGPTAWCQGVWEQHAPGGRWPRAHTGGTWTHLELHSVLSRWL